MMKRNIYTAAIAFFCSFLIAACNSELMQYEGETGIYFSMPTGDTTANSDTTYSETSSLPFIIEAEDVTEKTFFLKVKIIGAVSEHDREFEIRLNEEESTVSPQDYEQLEKSYTLPSGTVFGAVPIKFHRQGFKNTEKKMVLELVPNKEFSLPIKMWKNSSKEYVNVVRHTIIISDKYVQLPGYAVGQFGKFSQKKMEIILKITGKDLSYFNKKLSLPEAKAIGQKLDRYLKEHPQTDEDGEKMTAGEYIY